MRTSVDNVNNNDNMNNYAVWMLWQPSDSNPNYVQLVSATNSNFYNSQYPEGSGNFYRILTEDGASGIYNIYLLNWIGTNIPTVITDTPAPTIDTKSMNTFIKTKVDTTTIYGLTCDVVTLKLPYNGKALDVKNAISNSSSSPTLETYTGYNAQRWALVPVNPCYSGLSMPAASNIYLQKCPLSTENGHQNWYDTSTLYIQWTDTANTINNDDPHAYRYLTGTLNNSNSWTYTQYPTTWSTFTSENTTTSGYKRWANSPITLPECSDTVKEVGAQVQMYTYREVTALGKTVRFVSPTASMWNAFSKRPLLLKDGLAWTPEGLKINFTSNYFKQGSMNIRITDISTVTRSNPLQGGKIYKIYTPILTRNYTTSIVLDSTITIPLSYFSKPPSKGTTLQISGYVDTDRYAPGNNYFAFTDIVVYHDGNVDVTPTITELDGLRYKADVPYADTVKMWMSVDGQIYEIKGTVSDGHTIFDIYPPFCADYALFTSYENSDKTIWGTAYTVMPRLNIRAHCFTWSGGSVVIWLNKDTALTESFTFSAQSTTHTLAGRSHDVVTYLSDGEKNYTSVTGTVKGYIVPQLETYGTTRDSIEALVEQGHVVYRAPYGRVCNVAVTGADITTDKGITEVSISIVQEDDGDDGLDSSGKSTLDV